MNDNKRIIITEGEFDAYLLKKLLPKAIVSQSSFLVGNGYSSAVSKAKSILLQNNTPIVLILDSDSISDYETLEKKERLESMFASLGKENLVDVFLFQPEIEVVLLSNKEIREKLHADFDFFIHRGSFKKITEQKKVVDKLDDYDIKTLQRSEPLKSLIELFDKKPVHH
jgi:hypothetical protein